MTVPTPRQRLLDAACELFYAEGIHAVGVDRVLDRAGVTRATMYRHFRGKEALVVAYLDREDEAIRALFAQAAAGGAAAEELLSAVVEGVVVDATQRHRRGCPFINASAEFPEADSPVRRTVAAHRGWFRTTLADAVAATGRDHPDRIAAELVLLRDAMLVGAYLDGEGVTDGFRRAAAAVLAR